MTPTERSARRAAIRAARDQLSALAVVANTVELSSWNPTEVVDTVELARAVDVPLLADDADRYHDLVERVEALATDLDAATEADFPQRPHLAGAIVGAMKACAKLLRATLVPKEPNHG